MSLIENRIKQIVKFVEAFYKPFRIKVSELTASDKKEYVIGVFFKEISDDYISNREFKSIRENKEINLTREIRTYIENYLGIKTSGLQPSKEFFAPPENHMITIVAQSEK